ncbi:MAG: outer membrane lipoprotein-sorting protein [Bacteroidales bacterium]|nr:outer membrane lipoprotein-sorting protein [Bacteroidales bacterium]
MKKSMFLLVSLLVASVCSAQTLDEIVNKYYAANGSENLEKATTLIMEGRVSQMGTEMPMSIMVKKPGMVKMIITYSGMEIITAYDGEKGFMVNPLAGMTEPIEIPAEQLGGIQEYNMFRDNLLEAFKAGRLKLEGEEAVEGKPAFKLTITDEAGTVTTAYVDKESFLTVKTVTSVEQMGQVMEVESYIKEYMEVGGVKFGKVVTQMVDGMELGGMTIDKIELDTPIDDSVFRL